MTPRSGPREPSPAPPEPGKTDPIPPDQEELAEQAIAECPRAALLRGE